MAKKGAALAEANAMITELPSYCVQVRHQVQCLLQKLRLTLMYLTSIYAGLVITASNLSASVVCVISNPERTKIDNFPDRAAFRDFTPRDFYISEKLDDKMMSRGVSSIITIDPNSRSLLGVRIDKGDPSVTLGLMPSRYTIGAGYCTDKDRVPDSCTNFVVYFFSAPDATSVSGMWKKLTRTRGYRYIVENCDGGTGR